MSFVCRGSNQSIHELMQQYSSTSSTTLPKPTRPASAKYSNSTKLRPPSGKKTRPQSAKEPISDGKVSETLIGGEWTFDIQLLTYL